MALTPQTHDRLRKALRFVLAGLLLAGVCIPSYLSSSSKAWGATTGKTSQKILVRYGSGNTVDTWNESILTVDGKWAYCVQVDSHFKEGLTVSESDPVATGVWSQDLCTTLALIHEFVWSGEFESTGTLGKARHKVTNSADKYAVAQCYIWKALDDAGFSDYDWFSVTVDGEGLTGVDTDAQVATYIRENKDEYIGHASYYNCGSSQNVACNFYLEPAKGYIALKKASSNPKFVKDNKEYSLKDAVYGVFENEACEGDPVEQLTTDDEGSATSNPIRKGNYFVKEMNPSPGYELDETIYPVTVTANETTSVNAPDNTVLEKPKTGALELEKISSNPSITSNNACYSNEGAIYGIYSDKDCKNEIARMTTDENGKASAKELPLGVKYIREITAPSGMVLDSSTYSVVISAGKTVSVNSGFVSDTPKSCPVELLLSKYDAQLGNNPDGNFAQGAASLENAQFTAEYYAGYFENAQEARDSSTLQRTWVFKTDNKGFVKLDANYLVQGDALYYNSQNQPCLPLGTVIISEKKPPVGYLPNSDEYCIQITDDNSDRESVETYSAPSVPENVKRGDLELVKVGDIDMRRLSGVPFRITSQTTGESHIMVTDDNGYASTSAEWNAHTNATNENDGVQWTESCLDSSADTEATGSIEQNGNQETLGSSDSNPSATQGDEAEQESSTEEEVAVQTDSAEANTEFENSPYNSEAGIWFGFNGNGEMTVPVDDSLGALPFDTTTIEELPCPANRGLQLVKTSVIISKDKTVVDLGTIDDPKASLRTVAFDASDTDSVLTCSDSACIVDRVYYANLIPGREYIVNGTLVSKESGKAITDAEGNAIASSITFTPDEPDGHIELSFSLSTLSFSGNSLVVFEELCEEDRLIASHGDIEDADQTITVTTPTIATSAHDRNDGDNIVSNSGTVSIVDEVSYSGLEPGCEYTVAGILMDKATNKPASADGSPIAAQATFIPETQSGTFDVLFEFDASSFSDNTQLVAFETLSMNSKEIATHKDIDDDGQTILVKKPEIQTTLVDKADGDKIAVVSGKIELVDTVAYSGLVAGETYAIDGTLMDKSSKEPVLDDEGNAISSRSEFVPESSSGTAEVVFSFDASCLGGHELVAFETLSFDGKEQAVHGDLNDEAQTVSVSKPQISTHAVNAVSGKKTLEANSKAKVVDEVHVSGVQPGHEYTLVGMMMDKKTGMPLLCARNSAQGTTSNRETETVRLAKLWAELQKAANLPAVDSSSKNAISFENATSIDYKAAGEALQDYEDVVECMAMQVHVAIPEDSSFNADVAFPFSTNGVSGQIVVFEALVENETGKLVAVHADINDEEQTLEVPKSVTTSEHNHVESASGDEYDKTGNWLETHIWAFAFLAATGCLLAAYGLAHPYTKHSIDLSDA